MYVASLNSTDRKFCPSPPLSSLHPSTLCSLPSADWLEGKRGMRFCRLICQQIATDGPLSNGFSKLLFQGRANPFYQIAALSSSLPPFQLPHSLSSLHQSDFIFLSLPFLSSSLLHSFWPLFLFLLLFFYSCCCCCNLNTSRCITDSLCLWPSYLE